MPAITVLAETIGRLARAVRRRPQPHDPIYPDAPTAGIHPSAQADAGATIGRLRDQLTDMTVAVAQVDRYLRRENADHHLAAVEGPFTGDAAAAVATTRLWLTHAQTATGTLRQALGNAHIAAGGLAHRAQCGTHVEQRPPV